MHEIVVHRGRTVTVQVALGFDVSGDVFSSDIREAKSRSSALITSWVVSFATDGTDGDLVLTLDDEVTDTIMHTRGYMDIKRVTESEPVNVLDEPLKVVFRDSITV